jgi:predicted dithiol-disulfide oxidoreductase (DUF899 family)
VSGGSRSAGRLREELELACEDGYLMKELTVLAPKNDPYRLDTPANHANQEVGCDGCSLFADQVGHLAHLHARDTSFALISRAPIEKIEPYKRRMGWTLPVVLVVPE